MAPAHRRRVIRTSSSLRNFAALCVLLALAVRVAIPSGWMPSSEKAFALTVCTGMDVQTVWLDKDGALHKEDPSKGKAVDHAPCAFGGAAGALETPATMSLATLQPVHSEPMPFASITVSVGRGLAAPPPPAIGPPILV
jgi:hypothetical protein